MNASATDISAPASLYTIGYGGRTLTAFVTALRTFQIAEIIDVRPNRHPPTADQRLGRQAQIRPTTPFRGRQL